MATKWTDAQKNAIYSRNGTVLVSAAAGSGKTAVLVERVIQRLTDKEKPTNVENILVVTFTKAAAGEMKERINKSLSELIKNNPSDSFLKRQKMFLPNADICTMDSFCSRLVRENFQSLDISPDFTILSDTEHSLMKNDILTMVLDEIYESNAPENSALLELFSNGRNDRSLQSTILGIYEYAMSSPDPEKWIDDCFDCYFENVTAEKSVWGEYALSRVREMLYYLREKTDRILLDAGEEDKLGITAHNSTKNFEEQLKNAISLVENGGNWDEIRSAVNSFRLDTFGRFKSEEKDVRYWEIKDRCDSLKGDFGKISDIMCCTAEEFKSDIEYLKPIMFALKNCILKFMRLLLETKRESNSYYFGDVLHMALTLLIKDGKRTPVAEELCDNYDEILIDEFQDTNRAQNCLFNAISKNSENLFMVGDVKQSIYRFRQAMPEIFISYKDSFTDYNGKDYPAKISLDCNFRSRKGIVDGINFFFDTLMTRDVGDISYTDGEQLVYAADYSETDNEDVSVHIVRAESGITDEAHYIGSLIDGLIKSGMTVGKKGEERPLKYSDICILLRGMKDKASEYAGALNGMGIPTYYKKSGGFFDNPEIVIMMSLLSVIDNPVQDVPLMSVMLSPLFPFCEDDLAKMRCDNRSGNVYSLIKSNYETDEKCRYFIDTLDKLRVLSVTQGIGDLIRRIFEITSFDSVAGAMDNGEKRELNLQMLINYAENYEKNGGRGLTGFLRYVDKLRKIGSDFEDANTLSENDNVVRIMSIHKSKGLEFPVVILANSSVGFVKDNKSKAITDKTMGIGALRFDSRTNQEFETQPYVSLKIKNELEELSETMRVLYVALTRAKEKLYIVGSMSNPEKAIREIYSKYYTGNCKNAVALSLCNNFLQWIILCMLQHPSTGKLAGELGILNRHETDTPVKINFKIAEPPVIEITENSEKVKEKADKEILGIIKEKVNYKYPYAQLSEISLKYTASGLSHSDVEKYLASDNPAFMGKDELTPAQKGTVVHKFMEKCDMIKAGESVKEELDRLVAEQCFTQAEANAVNTDKLETFFNSDVFKRIMSAEKFMREKEFTMSVPAYFALNDIPETAKSEKVIIQGVIDGVIVNKDTAEIIDYKTDKVSTEKELIDRYSQQMRIYKNAVSECFGIEKIKVTLYSFGLSKEISVNLEKNT